MFVVMFTKGDPVRGGGAAQGVGCRRRTKAMQRLVEFFILRGRPWCAAAGENQEKEKDTEMERGLGKNGASRPGRHSRTTPCTVMSLGGTLSRPPTLAPAVEKSLEMSRFEMFSDIDGCNRNFQNG